MLTGKQRVSRDLSISKNEAITLLALERNISTIKLSQMVKLRKHIVISLRKKFLFAKTLGIDTNVCVEKSYIAEDILNLKILEHLANRQINDIRAFLYLMSDIREKIKIDTRDIENLTLEEFRNKIELYKGKINYEINQGRH